MLLSCQLTHLAESRGHKLLVGPACLDIEFNESYSLVLEQMFKAVRMPDSLLYGEQ